MSGWKDMMKGKLSDEEVKRYSRFLAIPFLVIILVIVIVFMDRSPKQADPAQKGKATGSDAATASDAGQDGDYELAENEIPEIRELVEAYFKARLDCDPEALSRVFGNADVGDPDMLKEQLQKETEYIESYENIVCYTTPGPDQNSYLVFVRSDIKLRQTETPAPSLVRCYVTKDAGGNYYIVEKPDERVSSFIQNVERSESVSQLSAEVDASLEEALESDRKLNRIYQILLYGAAPEATPAEAAETGGASEAEADGEQADAGTTESQTASQNQ